MERHTDQMKMLSAYFSTLDITYTSYELRLVLI